MKTYTAAIMIALVCSCQTTRREVTGPIIVSEATRSMLPRSDSYIDYAVYLAIDAKGKRLSQLSAPDKAINWNILQMWAFSVFQGRRHSGTIYASDVLDCPAGRLRIYVAVEDEASLDDVNRAIGQPDRIGTISKARVTESTAYYYPYK